MDSTATPEYKDFLTKTLHEDGSADLYKDDFVVMSPSYVGECDSEGGNDPGRLLILIEDEIEDESESNDSISNVPLGKLKNRDK